MESPSPLLPRGPLSEKVAEVLRERIISGELPPGGRLNERELAAEFEVSRIPLREALPLLEAEGFITTAPRRGAVVHTFTLRDAEEVFDLRMQLEPLAAACAARKVAAGADASPLLEALEFARSGTPGEESSGRNSDLHEQIVLLADHHLLRRMTSLMNGRVRWLFRLTPERDTQTMWREHEELVLAITSGQVALASALATAHVERGRSASLPGLAERLPKEPVARRRRR
jgi:DNA-binding GntR family transcriptional regulator